MSDIRDEAAAAIGEGHGLWLDQAWALIEEIDRLRTELQQHQWRSIESAPPEMGPPILGYNEAWIDPDFNPLGIRECFLYGDGTMWMTAKWCNDHDCYHTTTEDAPTHWMPLPKPPEPRPMTALTDSQHRVWHAINDFTHRTGVAPTLREIQRECGFASPTAARDHLSLMESKGAVYIYRPEHKSGPWRVVAL